MDSQTVLGQAAQDWKKAREMAHGFIPDPDIDRGYLELVHGAAARGLPDAQAKMGEYALRRGALVESYYWMKLARQNGMANMSRLMAKVRQAWAFRKYPPEYENVHDFFTEHQSMLGRAALRMDSGNKLPSRGRDRLRALADEGDPVASAFLGQKVEDEAAKDGVKAT